MSKYLLDGEKIIKNDKTFTDFIKSIFVNSLTFNKTNDLDMLLNKEDKILEEIRKILFSDIPRTDINYEELMCEYRNEIGDTLYQMDNNNYRKDVIHFFGKGAKKSFEIICISCIEIYFYEIMKEIKNQSTTSQEEYKNEKI